ncbi:MAG: EamA family transporter [Nodosilinea sp.]
MTVFALGLVLAAAFLHASWNFLAKRAAGGAAFVWLFGVLSTCIYAPLAVGMFSRQRPELSATAVACMAGSGALHTAYFLLLQQGYRVGDLSLVYPLARGTGPMIATVAAMAIFKERPTVLTLIGTGLIAVGIVLFTAQPGQNQSSNRFLSVGFALLTGMFIAAYTLWDKYAVSQLLVPPLLLDWSSNLTRSLLLTPLALGQWSVVQSEWQNHRREALGVACLCPLAYILVLTALVFSPVSAVAPAREISIVIGAAMGSQLLSEGHIARRLAAASLMVLGVLALIF